MRDTQAVALFQGSAEVVVIYPFEERVQIDFPHSRQGGTGRTERIVRP